MPAVRWLSNGKDFRGIVAGTTRIGKVELGMNDIHISGLPLDEAARAEAVRHLNGPIQVALVPAATAPTLPNPWRRLPPAVACLVADPGDWAAVASTNPLPASRDQQPLRSHLATAFGQGQAIVLDSRTMATDAPLPSLTPTEAPLPDWLRNSVEGIADAVGPVRSRTDLTALQAGILQLGDFLTPSHEHSQSIEGRGKRRAGDYWHAINHRREPDYGNAKYWFRHVGNHPLFAELAAVVPDLAGEFSPAIQSRSQSLIESGRLDPFHVVDLVSDACRRHDRELIRFAERLQWIEMVALLEWTLQDATG